MYRWFHISDSVIKHKYATRTSTFRAWRISSWGNKLWERAIWISRSTYYVHSIDVHNLLRNFNRRHGSRDTIHIPRKHRSRKLYINDLQRAENSGRVFSSFLRRIFVLLFLFHSGSFAPPPFPARFIAHYVGGSSCILHNGI